ncbi:hypothetical protein ACGFNV_30760 [Streptomyces sp. NPDC048751]|uniref:hypothetical protein n=1 Tax=Streptomyces sp. NPDC048751 TaxID=3365591 RepID=UPI00371A95D4
MQRFVITSAKAAVTTGLVLLLSAAGAGAGAAQLTGSQTDRTVAGTVVDDPWTTAPAGADIDDPWT